MIATSAGSEYFGALPRLSWRVLSAGLAYLQSHGSMNDFSVVWKNAFQSALTENVHSVTHCCQSS